jgi:hypothetical protein
MPPVNSTETSSFEALGSSCEKLLAAELAAAPPLLAAALLLLAAAAPLLPLVLLLDLEPDALNHMLILRAGRGRLVVKVCGGRPPPFPPEKLVRRMMIISSLLLILFLLCTSCRQSCHHRNVQESPERCNKRDFESPSNPMLP